MNSYDRLTSLLDKLRRNSKETPDKLWTNSGQMRSPDALAAVGVAISRPGKGILSISFVFTIPTRVGNRVPDN